MKNEKTVKVTMKHSPVGSLGLPYEIVKITGAVALEVPDESSPRGYVKVRVGDRLIETVAESIARHFEVTTV